MQPPSSAVSNASFRPSVMRRDSNSESTEASMAGLRGGLGNLNIRWYIKERKKKTCDMFAIEIELYITTLFIPSFVIPSK